MATMARLSSSSSANGNAPGPSNTHETATTTRETRSTSAQREESPPHFAWESKRHQEARTIPYDPSLLPTGSRSLAAIGLQAFWLGFTFALCSSLTTALIWFEKPWWRLSAFFACLSVFHFLEYYTTARFNLPAVRKDSFLLFNNGTAYNIAHSLATLEILISNFFPTYQAFGINQYTIITGLVLVSVGQLVRSVAMAQAGTNFNHTPAKTRTEGHELVTSGVYAWLRHPSYFGFYWWALGTQLLVGNKLCLLGYALALWRFFYYRIVGMRKLLAPVDALQGLLTSTLAEERTLVEFFGKDYEGYRKRTMTGIPFIS